MAIPVLLHFLFSSFHTMMADLSAESITARKHSALIGWDREVDKPALLCHKDTGQGISSI